MVEYHLAEPVSKYNNSDVSDNLRLTPQVPIEELVDRFGVYKDHKYPQKWVDDISFNPLDMARRSLLDPTSLIFGEHQGRNRGTLLKIKDEIADSLISEGVIGQYAWSSFESLFDEVYAAIKCCKRVGFLTCYNIALRIAWCLSHDKGSSGGKVIESEILPREYLYLYRADKGEPCPYRSASMIFGVEALKETVDKARPHDNFRDGCRLPVDRLYPLPEIVGPAWLVEDFLCRYPHLNPQNKKNN